MQYRRAFIQNSYVFITVVTNRRRNILVKNINLLRKSFKNAKRFYSFEIYSAVILPDHFHLMIKPENIDKYPQIIKLIKSYFSKNIDISSINDYELSRSRQSKKEKDIWQRRYWEHSIKDEQDLYKHIDYIHYNPVKHGYVKNVKDWKYSSFDKFVKKEFYQENWGCLEDIKGIENLTIE
ncbi:MAG: transposase [Candidatus Gastranaerophilales bacterium]|nr:transposase [Candidatus Gastranaerophilales bacterium]